MKHLLLSALLACMACGPPSHVQINPYAFSSPAQNTTAWVSLIADALQLNPYTDPATRADPYPCARATYAAQQQNTPLPRCYYVPMSLR